MALHMRRKYYHWLCSLAAFVLVYLIPDYRLRVLIAGVACASFAVMEILRLISPLLDWLKTTGHEYCLRPHERNGVTNSFWLALGFLLASLFREKEIACLAVIYAGFCDPVAEIAGHYFNTPSWSDFTRKTLGGSLAFFVVGFIFSASALYFLFHRPDCLKISLLGSFIAMALEAMDIKWIGYPISDNLIVPALSASLLKLLFFH